MAKTALPTGQAEWIWASIDEGQAGPETFYLVRDFNLDFRPRKARLLCLADEEYVAIVNGIQVAAGRYSGEGVVDEYAIDRFLKRGSNRVVISARSSRGHGGLLLHLEAQGARKNKIVMSDGSWRVLRHQVRGLGEAAAAIPAGEEVVVWGRPPMGRWPLPMKVRRLPTIPELLLGGEPKRAVRARNGGEDEVWKRFGKEGGGERRFGPAVTFDWGRTVTGYLAVEYPIDESPVALIYLDEKLPDLEISRPAAVLVGVEKGWLWSDSLPRRFRYATILVKGAVNGAMVYQTDPKKSAVLIPTETGTNAVFGLRSEKLRTPLENEFRSELHSLTGTAGREGL